MGAGNQTQPLYKSTECFYLLSLLSTLYANILKVTRVDYLLCLLGQLLQTSWHEFIISKFWRPEVRSKSHWLWLKCHQGHAQFQWLLEKIPCTCVLGCFRPSEVIFTPCPWSSCRNHGPLLPSFIINEGTLVTWHRLYTVSPVLSPALFAEVSIPRLQRLGLLGLLKETVLHHHCRVTGALILFSDFTCDWNRLLIEQLMKIVYKIIRGIFAGRFLF